jgi:hypothetical protein
MGGLNQAINRVDICNMSVLSNGRAGPHLGQSRRCGFAGALFTFVGVTLLWVVAPAMHQAGLALHQLVAAAKDGRQPEQYLPFILLATAMMDSIGGVILMIFPMERWQALLICLIPASLIHLAGVGLAAGLIARDHPSAQWSGLGTTAGIVIGVPYLLLLSVSLASLVRVIRFARSNFRER